MTMRLDQSELDALHDVQRDLLVEFDTVCRQNGLRYQLAAGTLLGAIRHGDIIPWDDDVDVIMPRDDYEQLMSIGQNVFSKDLFLQTRKSDLTYKSLFARLRRNDSELRFSWDRSDTHNGIFIDIFPMDFVSPNSIRGHLQRLLIAALRIGERVAYYIPDDKTSEGIRMSRISKRIISKFFTLVPLDGYLSMIEVVMAWYRSQNTGHVACLTQLTPSQLLNAERIRPASELIDCCRVPLRGNLFHAPTEYDVTLTRLYGNYMELPPVSQRVNPHPIAGFKLPGQQADDHSQNRGSVV
ncbi:MAG: phosphorylcholine transferase LicD [Armatimonadota bacterium]